MHKRLSLLVFVVDSAHTRPHKKLSQPFMPTPLAQRVLRIRSKIATRCRRADLPKNIRRKVTAFCRSHPWDPHTQLRAAIILAAARGLPTAEVCALFHITSRTFHRIVRSLLLHGVTATLTPSPLRGRPSKRQLLLQIHRRHPGISTEELAQRAGIHPGSARRILHAARSGHAAAARTGRPAPRQGVFLKILAAGRRKPPHARRARD